MKLKYIGPAHVFIDEAGNSQILTLEEAKAQAASITQVLANKGEVEIHNTACKLREQASTKAEVDANE